MHSIMRNPIDAIVSSIKITDEIKVEISFSSL